MKKIMLALLTAVSLLNYQSVFCDEYYSNDCSYENSCNADPCIDSRLYAKVFGGANFMTKDVYKTGFAISGAIGYRWNHGIRTEGEYTFRKNFLRNELMFDVKGHLNSSSLMANLLWDLPMSDLGCSLESVIPCIGAGLVPYIGAGIGYEFQQLSIKDGWDSKVKEKGFAWQLMAGAIYPISQSIHVSLDYTFHEGPSFSSHNHSLGIGLTFNK